jgi:hypothetical protein
MPDVATLEIAPVVQQPVPLLLRKSRPKFSKAVMQLKAIQDVIFNDFMGANGNVTSRCALARTYVLVQESLRVARGIPDPGSLRPDLDPVQMARALKRSNKRRPIDLIPSDIKAALKAGKGKSWAEESDGV